ncbi:ABC-type phosphate transport system, ATPase component [Hoeflea sp. IMCC20628]|uniref:ATP-binding cassette domain-containing protein n=1 Tax=Hoeflea sp. IMCC20628 TaxID=1620421 RepID=UPI00063BE1E4|nr:ATP-binding cassette domain-containing protein [Hoeflea sp. IMCC20628]AKI01987.1 ABC-type phosphate transport system, ATPase component [Hoeflea sp. IMCC20628]
MPDVVPVTLPTSPIEGAQTTRDRILPGALRVDGLSLKMAGKLLVNIEKLTLDPRSVTVIMGPNGAGKSLLLRLVHGLIAPTQGWISWGEVACGEATRSTQAMVFQKPVLLRRSVASNIDFVLRLRAGTSAQRRARCDELLTRVGLSGQAGQPARLLSGGEQQRLALARALATRPKVLLLDEATASLDPASVQMIEQIVLASNTDETKVIFVTHDIGQARRLADDVAFLHHGELVEHRPAEAFFAQPSSEAAKAYLSGRIVL